ncbi:MAG TPA: DUF4412 domain-containing protein [Opitutaceae bacterium]|jgi:hypothetical protein
MHLKSVFTLGAAILAAGAVHADNFEGKVTMTMSSDRGKQPQTINYEIKGQALRVDMAAQSSGHMGAVIMDFGKKQMTILMPQQHMYMTRPFGGAAAGAAQGGNSQAPAAAAGDRPSLVPSTEKTTLLGYPCTKYTVTDKGATTQMWVTDALGTFWGFGSMGANRGRGGMPGSSAPAGWEQALSGKGFFPLKISGTDASGHTFSMEVTSVSKQSIDDSEFQAPAGFREFNLGAMMGGFGH